LLNLRPDVFQNETLGGFESAVQVDRRDLGLEDIGQQIGRDGRMGVHAFAQK
jgi:hypothetical protein